MKRIIGIILILIFTLIPGCIDNDKNNEDQEICSYKFSISIESSSSYDLFVPIPVYSNINREIIISNLNDQLMVIEGKAIFIIQNTSFGPSIKINGSGLNEIEFSGSNLDLFLVNNEYKQLFLSMAKDKDNDGHYDDEYGDVNYHLKLENNTTVKVKIEFIYSHENGPGTYIRSETKIEGNLIEGWNNVKGTFLTEIE